MKVLNSWKDTINIRFKNNYNDITKSPLFDDMYPSLQNKVLESIFEQEKIRFKTFFSSNLIHDDCTGMREETTN